MVLSKLGVLLLYPEMSELGFDDLSVFGTSSLEHRAEVCVG